MKAIQMCFVKFAESQRQRQTTQGSSGVCATKPFQNWKKVIQKMKAQQVMKPHQLEAEALA